MFNSTWSNAGTLNVNNGTLALNGTGLTLASIGQITRVGGTVAIQTTLDNTGTTLTLDAVSGSWLLAGTIRNGTIVTSGGSAIIGQGGTLDGVSLQGDASILAGSVLLVTHGLNLNNATVTVTNAVNAGSQLIFTDTQTISGTGTILMSSIPGTVGNVQIRSTTSQVPATLTLASGVTLRGAGNITQGDTNTSLVNQGAILNDQSGQTLDLLVPLTNSGSMQAAPAATLRIEPMAWTNAGAISTDSGTLLLGDNNNGLWTNTGTITAGTGATVILAGEFTMAGLGTFSHTGATVNLQGTLDNTGKNQVFDATTGSWVMTRGTILGGSVAFSGGAALVISPQGGKLDGVTLNSDLDMGSGTDIQIIHDLTLNNATLTMGTTAPSFLEFGTSFGASGAQSILGTGQILMPASGGRNEIILNGTITLTITSGITVQGQAQFSGTPGGSGSAVTLINEGTIIAQNPGQTTIDPTLDNRGSLTVTGGADMLIIGLHPWSTSGTFTIDGAEAFLGSSGPTDWTNTGTINVINNGTADLGGRFTLASLGTLHRTGGTINVAGLLDLTGNTLTLNATTGSWQLAQGTVKGGTITTTGGATFSGGLGGGGTLDGVTLASDFHMSQSNSMTIKDGLTLNNASLVLDNTFADVSFTGTQTLGGTGQIVVGPGFNTIRVQEVTFNTPAVMTIGPNVTLSGFGTFTTFNSADSIVNQGTILASTAGQTLNIGVSLVNQGTLISGSGTLQLANLTNAGTLIAGAGPAVSISGTYTQQAGGILEVQLGGTGAGQFGRLTIAGAASLAGTLNIRLVNAFVPTPGDSFQVLTFGSFTGAFGSVNDLNPGDGIGYDLALGATSATLTAKSA